MMQFNSTKTNLELFKHNSKLSLAKADKKRKGQFYTPEHLVEYILSYLPIENTKTILDPSCGCGSFLLPIADLLIKNGNIYCVSNLYGIDIDKDAVATTKLALSSKCNNDLSLLSVIENQIIEGNAIVENPHIDKKAVNWEARFYYVIQNGGFDIIVGNPPYVVLTKKEVDLSESIYREIVDNNNINAFALMIGKSLEYLKEGGILAFILPKTILYVNSYSKLREYLLKKTSLLHIVDLGLSFADVRGEQIILILKKETPAQDHVVEIKTITDPRIPIEQHASTYIKQDYFDEFGRRIILCESMDCYSILQKIKNIGVPFKEVKEIDIFRGLTLEAKAIHQDKHKETDIEIIKGKSISKFYIKSLYYVNQQDLQKFNPNKLKKIMNRKIILQNIFSPEAGIIATYDHIGFLTLDTVTNIVIQDDAVAKYLLGLLHSKLMNFYIAVALFSKGRLTMHLDKSYIGDIPVVILRNHYFTHVVELVEKILNNKVCYKEVLKEIDRIFYAQYGLTDKEIQIIELEISKLLSKQSRW